MFAFTAFFVYEQYESEFDGLAKILFNRIKESNRLLMSNLPASMALYLQKVSSKQRNIAWWEWDAEVNDQKLAGRWT